MSQPESGAHGRDSMLRVGVVGCGTIARAVHLPLLTRMPRVSVAALADPDDTQRALAHRLAPTAATFADARALFEGAAIDAVVICSPSGLHAAHARAAVQRGLHIYLEKPLATSLAEAVPLRDAWRRAGVVGMMGYNYRFNDLISRLRARVRRGAVGPVVAVRTTFCAPSGRLPSWKQRRETGGGVLLDLASHHIDLIRFLLERKIRRVRAALRSRHTEDDCALLELELEGGAQVQSLFAFGAAPAERIEIHGEAGRLTVDRSASWDVEYEPAGVSPSIRGRIARRISALGRVGFVVEKLRSPLHEPSYRIALEQFVAAIHGSSSCQPDFDDGLTCLAVVEAAARSAECGRVIEMHEL
jgi:myo-inositol 2-dehydrogenase/D-chiro-inositol 1-dehydrogenase